MQPLVAIIGGTGVGDVLLAMPGERWHVPTPLGMVRGRLVSCANVPVFVTGRHAADHKVPPHVVPYLAMGAAMKQLRVRAVLATTAVGSLRQEWLPGTMALVTDFIDASSRNLTHFDRVVRHTDMGEAYSEPVRNAILTGAKDLGIEILTPATYLGVNGPRYESPAEIRAFQSWGADIVGMTGSSEAVSMREAGVPYACLAIVSNLAAGLAPERLDHEDVGNAVKLKRELVLGILSRAIVTITDG